MSNSTQHSMKLYKNLWPVTFLLIFLACQTPYQNHSMKITDITEATWGTAPEVQTLSGPELEQFLSKIHNETVFFEVSVKGSVGVGVREEKKRFMIGEMDAGLEHRFRDWLETEDRDWAGNLLLYALSGKDGTSLLKARDHGIAWWKSNMKPEEKAHWNREK